jgi:hypothetical protein
MDGTVIVALAAVFSLVVVFAISHHTGIKARLRRSGFDLESGSTNSPELVVPSRAAEHEPEDCLDPKSLSSCTRRAGTGKWDLQGGIPFTDSSDLHP